MAEPGPPPDLRATFEQARVNHASTEKVRQAVVMVHGMGEQRPLDTLTTFVKAALPDPPDGTVVDDDQPFFSRPDLMTESYESPRLPRPAGEERRGPDRADPDRVLRVPLGPPHGGQQAERHVAHLPPHDGATSNARARGAEGCLVPALGSPGCRRREALGRLGVDRGR